MASDEEIRTLCARVVEAEGKEFEAAVAALQAAIELKLAKKPEELNKGS